jgi:hypothetical protein
MQTCRANCHSGVCQFELEVEMATGEDREYKYTIRSHQETGEVEICSGNGHRSRHEDERALRACKNLIVQLGSTRRMNADEIIAAACGALERRREEIKKLSVKIEYDDGTEVGVKATSRSLDE